MDNMITLEEVLEILHKTKKKKSSQVKKYREVDWRALKKGDIVKSVKKYGPYFVNSKGEKSFQANWGLFEVNEVLDEGVYAYEYSPRGKRLGFFGGRRFIYMGEERVVDLIHRAPHKLVQEIV